MRSVILLVACAAFAAGETVYVDQRLAAATDDGPGTSEQPFRTFAHAVTTLKPGDRLLVRSGVYRERVQVDVAGTAEQPVTIEAEPGANVVLTGADVVTGFAREPDGRWSRPWTHHFMDWSKTGAHPDDPRHVLIGRGEQVLVDGYALTQVLAPEQVVRGTFCADTVAHRLWLWPAGDDDLASGHARVEAATRDAILVVRGAHVHVRGLRLRYAANQAQHGMAVFGGAGGVVEDCVFERANTVGAEFVAADLTVARCSFIDNGQLGFRAERAHRLHLVDCEVRGNNAKNFSRGWEAGGDKLVLCRGVVIERCRFVANRGIGLWFDIGDEDATVRNCLIADNEDAGLFYEISFALTAQDNVIAGNGFAETYGSWGADGGIALSSSPGCVVQRNLVIGNKEGLQFREFHRTTPRIDDAKEAPVWNHDETIRANLYAWNRDAQCWAWFDLDDERHWPRAMQEHPAAEGAAPENLAGGFAAKDATGQPTGLSLEALAFSLRGDCFALRPGQGLVNWGTAWRRNVRYLSLDQLRADLALEQDGVVVADLPFADALRRDFRLPAGHPALAAGCYPVGDVPGVVLGVR